VCSLLGAGWQPLWVGHSIVGANRHSLIATEHPFYLALHLGVGH